MRPQTMKKCTICGQVYSIDIKIHMLVNALKSIWIRKVHSDKCPVLLGKIQLCGRFQRLHLEV